MAAKLGQWQPIGQFQLIEQFQLIGQFDLMNESFTNTFLKLINRVDLTEPKSSKLK